MDADVFVTLTSSGPRQNSAAPCSNEGLHDLGTHSEHLEAGCHYILPAIGSTNPLPDLALPAPLPLWQFNSDDLPDILAEELASELPEDMRISSAELLTSGSLKLESADFLLGSVTLELRPGDLPDLLSYDSADEGSSSTLHNHQNFSPSDFSPSWKTAASSAPSSSYASSWQAGPDPDRKVEVAGIAHADDWQQSPAAVTAGLPNTPPSTYRAANPLFEVHTQASDERMMETLVELGIDLDEEMTLTEEAFHPREVHIGTAPTASTPIASPGHITAPAVASLPQAAQAVRRKVKVNRQKQQKPEGTGSEGQGGYESAADSEDLVVAPPRWEEQLRSLGGHATPKGGQDNPQTVRAELGRAAVTSLATSMDAAIKDLLVALGEPKIAGPQWNAYLQGLLASLWEDAMPAKDGLDGRVVAVLWPVLRLKERTLAEFMTELTSGYPQLSPNGKNAADTLGLVQAHHRLVMEERNRPQFWLDFFQEQLREQAMLLWTRLHFRNPTPVKADKERLGVYTRRNYKQTSDWFTNYRARKWRQEVAAANRGLAANSVNAIFAGDL